MSVQCGTELCFLIKLNTATDQNMLEIVTLLLHAWQGNLSMFVTGNVQLLVPFQKQKMQDWICYSCDSHLKRERMSSLAVANNLALAKILPFAKIIALPKGQQRAVHDSTLHLMCTIRCRNHSKLAPKTQQWRPAPASKTEKAHQVQRIPALLHWTRRMR